MRLSVGWIARSVVAVVGFMWVMPASAQIEQAVVAVDGLACPFCVNGVEKHVKAIGGVNSVTTSLKKGEVRFTYEEGAEFDLKRIREAVIDGGFTPGAVAVTAVGFLKQNADAFVLEVAGTGNAFLLHAPHPEEPSKTNPLRAETHSKLKKFMQSETKVRITGEVHDHPDTLPGLAVTHVEEIDDA